MPNKFPIGSRVGNRVVDGMTYKEIPMRVSGYDGLKNVIAVFLEDHGPWKEGQATVVSVKNLTAREEVRYIPGEAENDEGPAIGWMELDGLSVGLTRAKDGALLLSLERAPDCPQEQTVTVRVARSNRQHDVWEGDI
jgi:hypothetical protein